METQTLNALPQAPACACLSPADAGACMHQAGACTCASGPTSATPQLARGLAAGNAALGHTAPGHTAPGQAALGQDAGGIGLAVSTVIFALQTHPDTGVPALTLPLVRRQRDPYAGLWALPGGWVDPSESLTSAAARQLATATGVRPAYLEQLYTFGAPDRSPDGRVVSVVYWALVRPEHVKQSHAQTVDPRNLRWFVADDIPHLAFDHDSVVAYALWRLRNKVEQSALAQAFLGDTFTLTELRHVHEAVLQRELDPANFRRQMETSGTVVDTGHHVTGGRHRPPKLYRYNTQVPLVDNGPLVDGKAHHMGSEQ